MNGTDYLWAKQYDDYREYSNEEFGVKLSLSQINANEWNNGTNLEYNIRA